MLRVMAVLLLMPSIGWAQMVAPEWATCRDASECVAVKNVCWSGWHGVNTSHAAELEKKIVETRATVKCSWPPPELAPAVLDCVNGLCVVTNDGN